MKAIFQEFKEFVARGNVIDMAVGIIVGASFSKIVNVLVKNVIMPPIGWMIGGVDFSDLKITLKQATTSSAAVTIDYGLFLNTLIDFFIIAVAIFILIKLMNTLYKKRGSSSEKTCPFCEMAIPKQAKKCGYCTSDIP